MEEQRAKQERKKEEAAEKLEALREAVETAGGPGRATVARTVEIINNTGGKTSDDTVRKYLKELGLTYMNGLIVAKDEFNK